MGTVIAVNISRRKGTQKQNIGSCTLIEDWGLEGDAHAGRWHRQVSLLSYETFVEFREKQKQILEERGSVDELVRAGSFGENLLVSGFDFKTLPVGTRLQCGEVILEITQIGKKCHSGCEIYRIMGDCIMPREGVFARVIHGGTIHVGDEMRVILP